MKYSLVCKYADGNTYVWVEAQELEHVIARFKANVEIMTALGDTLETIGNRAAILLDSAINQRYILFVAEELPEYA